jgi:hypothetical protein
LTFAWAAPAGATTYCAAPASGCGGGDFPTIAAALSASSASATADVVQLGAATYTDGPWSTDLTGKSPVTIQGVGDGDSRLAPAVFGPTLTITNGDVDNVVIYSPQEGIALNMTQGTLSRTRVVVSNFGRGVAASAATIERSSITPLGPTALGTSAVLADNSTVADTFISTTDGVETVNPPVAVRRSTIVTKGFGLQSAWNETRISDSVIVLDDPTAVGVLGVCDLAIGTITIEATNLTVTAAVNGGVAFRSTGGQLCGGHVAVSSTLVEGVGTTADCAPGIGTASVAFSYSDVDLGAGKVTGACPPGSLDAGHNFLADPKLASPGTLQPVPRFDSPLVDAGDPAAPGPGQQPTDLGGLPRTVNGRRDIGALEYGRRAPSLMVAPEVATVKAGVPLAFKATVSDPDLGDAVLLGWSFGDGGTGTGEEVIHSFSSAGPHVVTATATDSAGVVTTATVPVEVVGTEVLGTEMPGLGMAKSDDTGPPVTIGLKGPKKVRRGKPATFSFSSSKPGGTFMCRVDRKPWKPCASPFKVKTNRLGFAKRHRFSVYAVDSAGTADATPLSRGFSIGR